MLIFFFAFMRRDAQAAVVLWLAIWLWLDCWYLRAIVFALRIFRTTRLVLGSVGFWVGFGWFRLHGQGNRDE